MRDAAFECLQEVYRVLGDSLLENLRRQSLRPVVYKEIVSRLDEISPTGITVQETALAAQGPSNSTATTAHKSQTPAPSGQELLLSKVKDAKDGSCEDSVTRPVIVSSDRELASQLDCMVASLHGTSVDWQQRVSLLQRLQGLALGCPPHLHDAFLDAFRALREPLVTQVEDRRSMVSKQACSVLSTLSTCFGIRFAENLLYFLPILFRILPITVQASVWREYKAQLPYHPSWHRCSGRRSWRRPQILAFVPC